MVPMTSQGISGNLASWNDGPAATAIREFVARVATEGSPEFVPPDERVAVFDNDGTLWCEKPMPIELGFILKRLAAMAERDQSLRDRQPWKAAYGKDYHWLGDVITKHYHGDDSDVKVLLGGILQAFAGMSVDDYEAAAHSFLHEGRHPTLGHRFRDCGYRPMIDLLDYLAANGFTSYIASGGDRDFMRPVTEAIYGIPSERVIGSSNGDIPMLRFAGGPSRPGPGAAGPPRRPRARVRLRHRGRALP
jgi:phosphoserine phosphatase